MELKVVILLTLSCALFSHPIGILSAPNPNFFGKVTFPPFPMIQLPNGNSNPTVTIPTNATIVGAQPCIVVRGCIDTTGAPPDTLCAPVGDVTVCVPAMASGNCLWPIDQRNCILEDVAMPKCACRNLDP